MIKDNKKKSYKLLLYDYAESISCNEENATNFLKEEGIDVEKYILQGIKSIKKTQFIEIAKENKIRDEALLEKALILVKKLVKENLEKTNQVLVKLLHKKIPSVQFRNLDKLDDDGIRELLQELDLVKLLEELDKDKEL